MVFHSLARFGRYSKAEIFDIIFITMNASRRRQVGLAVLLAGLFLLGWSSWPTRSGQRSIPIAPSDLLAAPADTTGLPGGRITLEWPQTLRTGEGGTVRLKLDGATGEPGGAPAYNRLVEARLEFIGLQPAPAGEISEPLPPGQPALLQWSIQPRAPGSYTGRLWIALRFVPKSAVETAPIRRVLSAQRLELRAASLLGLGISRARGIGIAGALAGALLILETFLEHFWRQPKNSLR